MTSDSPTPTPPERDSDGHSPAADDVTAVHDAPTRGNDPIAPPPAGPRRTGLYRSTTDRMLSGVCGGIAERYGIDAVLIRLAFLASLLIGGAGLLFYIAAAIVIPNPPSDAAGQPGAAAPGVPAGAADNGILRVFVALAVGIAVLCGLATVAAVSFLTTAVLGVWPVAIVLVVLAAVLVVAAKHRRAAGTVLVLIAAFAVPGAVAVLADVSVDRSVGQRTEIPATTAEAAEGYRLGFGELIVDLREIAFTARNTPVTVPVRVGIGRAVIVVPDDQCVAWTFRTSVGIGGNARVLDQGRPRTWFGSGQDRTFRVDHGGSSRRPQVTVDAHVRGGDIVVVDSIRALDWLPDRAAGNRSTFRTDACRTAGASRP